MNMSYLEFSSDARIETSELEHRSLGIDTKKPNREKPCLYYGNGCGMRAKCKGGWQMKNGDCELYCKG